MMRVDVTRVHAMDFVGGWCLFSDQGFGSEREHPLSMSTTLEHNHVIVHMK